MGMGVSERVVGAGTIGAKNCGWVTMNQSLPSLRGSLFAQFLSSEAVNSASFTSMVLGIAGVWTAERVNLGAVWAGVPSAAELSGEWLAVEGCGVTGGNDPISERARFWEPGSVPVLVSNPFQVAA